MKNTHTNTKKYERCELIPWKKKIKKAQQCCYVSGLKTNLEVHHLNKPFSEIFKEAHENLNLEYHEQTEDYKPEDLEALTNEVLRLHEEVTALVLESKIHSNLHKQYGLNFTMNQVEEFKLHYKGDR